MITDAEAIDRRLSEPIRINEMIDATKFDVVGTHSYSGFTAGRVNRRKNRGTIASMRDRENARRE